MRTLEDLKAWSTRRTEIDHDRPILVVAAWAEGSNITQIAKAAGVARGTIYNDLRRSGIVPGLTSRAASV